MRKGLERGDRGRDGPFSGEIACVLLLVWLLQHAFLVCDNTVSRLHRAAPRRWERHPGSGLREDPDRGVLELAGLLEGGVG